MLSYLKEFVRFIRFFINRIVADKCQQSAAALTYTSLFALVPMMTVSYSFFSMIPAFNGMEDRIQNLVFEYFVPDAGSAIQDYLSDFSSQARNLTSVGIGILIVTAFMMLKTIEKTMNGIWDVKQNRKGLASFLLYWAVLSLGPLLVGAGLMMSTYLMSLELFTTIGGDRLVGPMLRVLPWFLTTLAFCLLYVAVPNCRVSLKHGLIGAIIASLIFEIAKKLFGLLMAKSSYTLIYGTFAAVPLFLIWLFVSWMIVLSGAVLVRCFSVFRIRIGADYSDLIMTFALLKILWEKQQQGVPLKASDAIRGRRMAVGSLGIDRWQRLRDMLIDHQIMGCVGEGEYVLVRDLHTFSLWELVQLFGAEYTATPLRLTADLENEECDQFLSARLHKVQLHSENVLGQPVASFFDRQKGAAE
ncbi:MAG: YihY family inner membrane protein [Pseudomonadales bacterium]|nr:YihY family inner membrane protein [Pseudomonadales bacterium]